VTDGGTTQTITIAGPHIVAGQLINQTLAVLSRATNVAAVLWHCEFYSGFFSKLKVEYLFYAFIVAYKMYKVCFYITRQRQKQTT